MGFSFDFAFGCDCDEARFSTCDLTTFIISKRCAAVFEAFFGPVTVFAPAGFGICGLVGASRLSELIACCLVRLLGLEAEFDLLLEGFLSERRWSEWWVGSKVILGADGWAALWAEVGR